MCPWGISPQRQEIQSSPVRSWPWVVFLSIFKGSEVRSIEEEPCPHSSQGSEPCPGLGPGQGPWGWASAGVLSWALPSWLGRLPPSPSFLPLWPTGRCAGPWEALAEASGT